MPSTERTKRLTLVGRYLVSPRLFIRTFLLFAFQITRTDRKTLGRTNTHRRRRRRRRWQRQERMERRREKKRKDRKHSIVFGWNISSSSSNDGSGGGGGKSKIDVDDEQSFFSFFWSTKALAIAEQTNRSADVQFDTQRTNEANECKENNNKNECGME